MTNNQRDTPIEEDIAKFLNENDITIVPEIRGDYEALCYVRHNGIDIIDLGETVYNIKTGAIQPASLNIMKKRHRLEGFVNNVTRPMSILLKQTKDFYDERFGIIQDTCDRVEGRYEKANKLK